MNIRLFSVVLAAFSSLALAACTITTTDGTGGAGGGGGSGATGSTTTTTTTAGVGGTGGTGGAGGSGGAAACVKCSEAITNTDVSNICAGTSTDVYDVLNACACDAAKCQMDCGSGTNCAAYDGMESQACIDCIQANCQNEFNACANDL